MPHFKYLGPILIPNSQANDEIFAQMKPLFCLAKHIWNRREITVLKLQNKTLHLFRCSTTVLGYEI